MKKNPKAGTRFPMLGTNHMVSKEPRGARKMRLTNKKLEQLYVWFVEIIYFMIIYTLYVLTSVACIILSGAALFLQILVNNNMHPAEPIGFLISVLFGIVMLGVLVWEGGK